VEKLTNSINVFVFTTLEPYMKPILSAATHVSLATMMKRPTNTYGLQGLAQSSAEIVNSHDQLEVFNDPNASDPTHRQVRRTAFSTMT
jgi:hypothetical protein